MAFATTHLAQQQRRLDRSHRGLLSLVLARSGESAPVERLLLVVAGEHAEPYRDAGVEGDTGEPVGDGPADVLEVRCATADDDAQSDDRVVALLCQRLRRDGQLERAGDAQQRKVLDPRYRQGPVRAGDEPVGHLLVPTGGEDRDPQAVRVDGRSSGRPTTAHPPTSTSSTNAGSANGERECANR